MPLIKSAAPAAIGQNIQEMQASGYPPNQAQAAALNTARQAGGAVPPPKHAPPPKHHKHLSHAASTMGKHAAKRKHQQKTARNYGFE